MILGRRREDPADLVDVYVAEDPPSAELVAGDGGEAR
jgi:hypothetical protein